MDVELPSTDDFDIIAKYKDEIDGFCKEEGIEVFDDRYWSSRECNAVHTWFYHGATGVLNFDSKYFSYSVRPVLTHKAEF